MDRRNALKRTGVLAGTAIAMPALFSLLQACKEEPRLTWQPEFFSESEARTVSEIVDMILPRTDTPGALDVKVDMFIDKVVAHTYGKDGQDRMRDEIAAFNSTCESDFGAVFIDLDATGKEEVLRVAEKTSGKLSRGVWGQAVGPQEDIGFYRSLKSMAIWAYFTSEEIGENVLSYDPVPGVYEGCKPLSEVGNRWSL